MLVYSVLAGLVYLSGVTAPPGSVVALMPAWEVHVWAALLAVSGAVGLAGCWWRGNVAFGLRLEGGAMLINAAALAAFAAAAFAAAGWRALVGGGVAAALAWADLVRAGQIKRDLRGL